MTYQISYSLNAGKDKWMTNCVGYGRGGPYLFWGISMAFAWWHCGKQQKTSTQDFWPPGYDMNLGHVEYNGILPPYLQQWMTCFLNAFTSMQSCKAFIYMARIMTNLIIFLQKETTEIWATHSQRKDSVHLHMVRAYHILTILVPQS
jgi:hypothetical protein